MSTHENKNTEKPIASDFITQGITALVSLLVFAFIAWQGLPWEWAAGVTAAAVAILGIGVGCAITWPQRTNHILTKYSVAFVSILLASLLVNAVLLWAKNQGQTAQPSTSQITSAGASSVVIVGIEFRTLDWNPRLVDLRKAATDGIPVATGGSLDFPRIWIGVERDAPSTSAWVWAEVYQNEQLTNLVGATAATRLLAGVHEVGPLYVKQNDGTEIRQWQVQSAWLDQFFYFVVMIQQEGQEPVPGQRTKVRLTDNGTAWLLDSPYVSFAAISYRVNGGRQQLLDLSRALADGLNAGPDDELTIDTIWYRTNAKEATAQAEAYLTAGGYDESTLKTTQYALLYPGVAEFTDVGDFRWMIQPDHKFLIVTLFRKGGAILDRLVLPLEGEHGAPGLIRINDTK